MLISCKNISAKQTWHKGNLHTHSLWSDGDDFPEMIIQWYKDNDYQFIAFRITIPLVIQNFGMKSESESLKIKL